MRRIDYGRDTSEHTLGAKEKKLIGERIRRLTAQKIQSRQAERRGPGTTDRQNIENDFERIDIVLPGQYEFGNIGEQRGLYSDNTGYESDFGYDEDVSIMDFGSDDERSKSPIFNNENPESVVDEEDYGVNSCGKTTRSIGSRSVISTSYSAYDCPEEEFNDKLGELAVIVASKHVSGKHRYIHRIAVFNGPEGVLGFDNPCILIRRQSNLAVKSLSTFPLNTPSQGQLNKPIGDSYEYSVTVDPIRLEASTFVTKLFNKSQPISPSVIVSESVEDAFLFVCIVQYTG
ncbi:Hypothetical protein CINCED_3A003609 [Cinara cedri]|uniref:Uncharacterized protein n=1 Tax=Cinara cedri TaxID=506608 RepID=A0A5E4N9F4_9HEMI|nr:Hypothetical protein CINCED_3A003609 [Cinara cedri]